MGQGIWLPKKDYDGVIASARTNSQFIVNLAVALFGLPELKRCKLPPRPWLKHTARVVHEEKTEPLLDIDKLLAIGGNSLFYQEIINNKITKLNLLQTSISIFWKQLG